MTATSSDQTLIPNANLVLGGVGTANRTLTITPAANANGGPVTITVNVTDGASNVSSFTFDVSITAVNDTPSFAGGGDVTVAEDSAAYSAAQATSINDGDPEVAQTLTFNVSNDNTGLFAVQPEISPTGVLIFTPAANANGSATVTVSLTDDVTAGGAAITTATQTFVINLTAANDSPTFVVGGDVTVAEDSAAYSATQAASISDGDPEVTQTLTFNVSNDNTGLFAVQPQISPTGVLIFTPAANANGSAIVTITLTDDATAGGAAITTASQTFVINVTAANDTPTFIVGGNVSVLNNSGAYSAAQASSIDDGDPEVTQTLTFGVSNDATALFAVQPELSPTGVLTFTPAAGANGTAIVSVSLTDDTTAGGAAITTAVQTFTITVTAPNVAPTANNDGVYNMFVNTTLIVNNVGPLGLGVLANDTDPDSASLTAMLSPAVQPTLAGHTLNLAADGSFTFAPSLGFTGLVTFTYLANDGLVDSSLATVTINVQTPVLISPVINGSAGIDDVLIRRTASGTDVEVLINGVVQAPFPAPYAMLANLTVNGLGGADTFTVDFTNGDPIPAGGMILDGGTGTDAITVTGLAGVSTGRTVTATETTLDGLGTAPTDIAYSTFETLAMNLTGGADRVIVDMDNAATTLTSATIRGGFGNDQFDLVGVLGLAVTLVGEDGSDSFGSATAPIRPVIGASTNISLFGDTPAITTNPGGGVTDRLYLDMATSSNGTLVQPLVIVDTIGGVATAMNTQTIRFGGIDDIDLYNGAELSDVALGDVYMLGTTAADRFVLYRESGSTGIMVRFNGLTSPVGPFTPTGRLAVSGGEGNDYIEFNFTLGGFNGASFNGGAGNDTLVGGPGADTLIGGDGDDTLRGGEGNDLLFGDDQFQPDSLIPYETQRGSGLVVPLAVGGNDVLDGGGGNDILFGGVGSDNLNGNLGDDYVHGGDGADTLNSGGGNDILRGGNGADLINGDAGADILIGGAGDDRLFGRGGRDIILAGDGADQIQDSEASSDVVVASLHTYDRDNLFSQPGASLSGLSDADLALQALMFSGSLAWNGPALFAARVSNLGLAAGASPDVGADMILGNVGGQDYILSSPSDIRLNTAGDLLATV